MYVRSAYGISSFISSHCNQSESAINNKKYKKQSQWITLWRCDTLPTKWHLLLWGRKEWPRGAQTTTKIHVYLFHSVTHLIFSRAALNALMNPPLCVVIKKKKKRKKGVHNKLTICLFWGVFVPFPIT